MTLLDRALELDHTYTYTPQL